MTLLIDATSPANTGTMFGIAVQHKFRGVQAWAAPLVVAPVRLKILLDSVTVSATDSIVFFDVPDSLIAVADSTRFAFIGKSSKGRTILRWAKILAREK
jgi:hypothetical protein